jgi:hypothetical protein
VARGAPRRCGVFGSDILSGVGGGGWGWIGGLADGFFVVDWRDYETAEFVDVWSEGFLVVVREETEDIWIGASVGVSWQGGLVIILLVV